MCCMHKMHQKKYLYDFSTRRCLFMWKSNKISKHNFLPDSKLYWMNHSEHKKAIMFSFPGSIIFTLWTLMCYEDGNGGKSFTICLAFLELWPIQALSVNLDQCVLILKPDVSLIMTLPFIMSMYALTLIMQTASVMNVILNQCLIKSAHPQIRCSPEWNDMQY